MLTERFRSKHLLAYMQNEVGQHAHARSHIHMHVNINFKQLWCTGKASLSLFHNSISLFGFGHILKMPEVLLCVWVRKRKRQWNDIELCIVACFQLAQKKVTLSLENQQHEKKNIFSDATKLFDTHFRVLRFTDSLHTCDLYFLSVSFTSK